MKSISLSLSLILILGFNALSAFAWQYRQPTFEEGLAEWRTSPRGARIVAQIENAMREARRRELERSYAVYYNQGYSSDVSDFYESSYQPGVESVYLDLYPRSGSAEPVVAEGSASRQSPGGSTPSSGPTKKGRSRTSSIRRFLGKYTPGGTDNGLDFQCAGLPEESQPLVVKKGVPKAAPKAAPLDRVNYFTAQ